MRPSAESLSETQKLGIAFFGVLINQGPSAAGLSLGHGSDTDVIELLDETAQRAAISLPLRTAQEHTAQ